LTPLSNSQRQGIILGRARSIVGAVSSRDRAQPEVNDLRELINDSSEGTE
jgi:hypothetical protein